jgi:hypothetical protein
VSCSGYGILLRIGQIFGNALLIEQGDVAGDRNAQEPAAIGDLTSLRLGDYFASAAAGQAFGDIPTTN